MGNKIIEKGVSRSLKIMPFSILRALEPHRLLLPLYHIVSDEKVPHITNLYKYKNVKQFESDLDFFQKYFTPVSLPDLIQNIKLKKELPSKSFLLTFDDGYREVYDVIVPILKKRTLPAVFFLSTAFIDNKEMFYRNKVSLLIERLGYEKDSKTIEKIKSLLLKRQINESNINASIFDIKYPDRDVLDEIADALGVDFQAYLKEKRPYLSSGEVSELIQDGFAIGSHSIDHPLFQLLPLENQLQQVKASMNILKEKFNIPYRAFSFPFNETGVSKEFYNQTHFNGEIDISFGTSLFKKGYCDNNLQRQSMEITNDPAKAIYKKLFREEILFNIFKG